MALQSSRPFAVPTSAHLSEASARSRELRAQLIEQLEAALATDESLTVVDVVEALEGARVWFAEERDEGKW